MTAKATWKARRTGIRLVEWWDDVTFVAWCQWRLWRDKR